jgi:prepilin-type N-terminal cleavage/methylation domain-containing protein
VTDLDASSMIHSRIMPHGGAAPSSGFTLVEMMVALVAGLIVSAAVIAFALSSMKSNGEYVQSTRLTQELRNTLDLVTRDLSRAGYNDNSLKFVSLPSDSPFAPVFVKDVTPFVTSGTSSTYANADVDGCVLYAYDRTFPIGYATNAACDATDGCGTAGVVDQDNGEIRGLRRACVDGACDGEADDIGVIEYAESATGLTPACGGATADYTTNPATCNAASGWCPLSDPTLLNITRFMVINTSADISTSMRVRDLSIHLEGQMARLPDYTRGVSTKVKIRADCISPTVADCGNAPSP